MRFLIAFLLLAGVAYADDFIQASSSLTQCPGPGGASVIIDMVDEADGIELIGMTVFRVSSSGVYLMVAAPQVGGGNGCFNLWMEKNEAPIANSNVQLCMNQGKDVIISQGASTLVAGDTIRIMMSSAQVRQGLCIEAIQPVGEPLVPSIIFTMVKY